jgi:hypothetical protein
VVVIGPIVADFNSIAIVGLEKRDAGRQKEKKVAALLNILYIGLYNRRTEGGHRLVWSRTLAFHAKGEVSP